MGFEVEPRGMYSVTEKRALSVTPNASLQKVSQEVPHFYERGNFVCGVSSINFIGSLLVQRRPDLFDHQILAKQEHSPIELVHDVPLYPSLTYDSRPFINTALGVTADDVLMKWCAGLQGVGVVLNGPYAGVVLHNMLLNDDYSLIPFQEGMAADKIWNDELLVEAIERDSAFLLRDNQSTPKLKNLVNEELKARPHLRWTTELFFDLCEDQGFPIARKDFYYTRSRRAINESPKAL